MLVVLFCNMKYSVILLLALVSCVYCQSCTHSVSTLMKQRMFQMVQGIREAKSFDDIGAAVGAYAPWQTPGLDLCLQEIGTYSKAEEREFNWYNSINCPYDESSEEYRLDPCCSRQATDGTCCVPRNITLVKDDFMVFNASQADHCRHPVAVKLGIELYQMYEPYWTAECRQITVGDMDESDYVAPMLLTHQCYSKVVALQSCDSDDDCLQGVQCKDVPLQGKICLPDNDKIEEVIINCVSRGLKEEDMRFLRQYLGVKGKTPMAEVLQAFRDKVTYNGCVGYDSYDLGNVTDAECVNRSVCNLRDGEDCVENGTFCGSCFLNDVCVGSRTYSSDTCTGYACTDGTVTITAEECTNKKRCSVGDTTEEAVCATLGHCSDRLDIPEMGGCFMDVHYKSNGDIDESYGRLTPIGQYNTTYISKTECEFYGGVWKTRATNRTECEAYESVCYTRRFVQPIPRNETECIKCHGVYKSPYQWVPARMISETALPLSVHTMHTVHPNEYGRKINSTALQEMLVASILHRIKPVMVNYMTCVSAPFARTMFAYTCDCRTTNLTECFVNEPIVARGKAWARLAKRIASKNAIINTYNETIDDDADCADVELTEIVNSPDSRRREVGQDVYDSTGVVVGEVVGNGVLVNVTPAAVSPFQLCVTVDPYVSSTYTVWDIGMTTDSGKIVALGTGQYEDGQVCGDVMHNTVYYPVKRGDMNYPDTSSAAAVVMSLCAVVLALLL